MIKMARGVHHLDSGMWPIQIFVTDDRNGFHNFLHRNDLEHPGFPTDRGVNGSAHVWVRGGEPLVLVVIDPGLSDKDAPFVTLHEAVHVSDFMFEHIGETKPGTETRAYFVEWLTRETLRVLGR